MQGDITGLCVDGIVNPANSYGYMGGGVAAALKEAGGEEIELEAISHAPIPIGHAILTTAGTLKASYIIHSPTMAQPAEKIDASNVKEATWAALEAADERHLKKIAIPGMGTGEGEVPKRKAAEAMIETIVNFNEQYLVEAILIDKDQEMVDEWKRLITP